MNDLVAMREELLRVDKIDPRRLWFMGKALDRLLAVLKRGGVGQKAGREVN